MRKNSVNTMLRISLFSAFIAICSIISIPFLIPLTLQTFAIFLGLFTLGGKKTTAAIAVYTALGLVGLPVFAGFGSGIGYLFGASGGFILSFPLASILFLILESAFGTSRRLRLYYSFASLLVIYIVGGMWFAFVYAGANGFLTALAICALSYAPFDILKLFMAYGLSIRINRDLMNFEST